MPRRNVGVVSKPLEKDHQSNLFDWFHLIRVPVFTVGLAQEWLPLSDLAFAVPNGMMIAGTAKQRGMYMASLKKQGFKGGVSDIVLPYPTAAYHGLFIEMKREKSSPVAADQVAWRNLMRRLDYRAEIVVGFDAARALVLEYIGENHRTVSPVKSTVFMV